VQCPGSVFTFQALAVVQEMPVAAQELPVFVPVHEGTRL